MMYQTASMFDKRYTKDFSDEEANMTGSGSNFDTTFEQTNLLKKGQKPKKLNEELRDYLTENS